MKKVFWFFFLLVACSNIIIGVLLIAGSCSTSTVKENGQTVVNLETDNGITTGVLIERQDTFYVILTVAHLCEPTALINDDILWMAEIDISIENGSFCMPTIKFTGKDERETGLLSAINFKDDLALFIVETKKRPIVKMSEVNHVYYGQRLYSITALPEFDYPLIAFGRVGGLIREQTSGVGTRPKRVYIQTQFMMGSGSSGSPVFDMDNELVGLHSVELTTGGLLATRFSFSQPIWTIRKFIKQARKYNMTWNQENGNFKPLCIGTEFQCAVIHGTGRLLEEFLED